MSAGRAAGAGVTGAKITPARALSALAVRRSPRPRPAAKGRAPVGVSWDQGAPRHRRPGRIGRWRARRRRRGLLRADIAPVIYPEEMARIRARSGHGWPPAGYT